MFYLKPFIQLLNMAVAFLLVGCATNTIPVAHTMPPPSLNFLDVSSFDRDLSVSLTNNVEKVEVSFYDPVSPNQLPERIDKWIAAVQQSGGKITVQRPVGEPVPKGPFVLASLLGAAFSSAKTLAAIQREQVYSSAKGRDALLVLERDKVSAKVFVSKIVFTRSNP